MNVFYERVDIPDHLIPPKILNETSRTLPNDVKIYP